MIPTAAVSVSKRSLRILQASIGIVYIWFGMLKFFHGYSPAEELAINTINKLTFGLIPSPTNIILLAVWETAVGLLLILRKWTRLALVLLFIHMSCTFAPLVLFPALSFNFVPYGFTLIGQYIMKNVIIVCAAAVIWQEERF